MLNTDDWLLADVQHTFVIFAVCWRLVYFPEISVLLMPDLCLEY